MGDNKEYYDNIIYKWVQDLNVALIKCNKSNSWNRRYNANIVERNAGLHLLY